MLKLDNITKSFGSNQVLKGVDLDIPAGTVCGIVGENGAGKTTLFRCIAGLETHDGTLHSDVRPLKDHLGFLVTHPVFFSRITGREYLHLLCRARGLHDVNFDQRNIFDLPLDQYAELYSTGMQKKLALMAILLQRNEIFILDEPFNGVDIHSNMMIYEIIKYLKAQGKAILISSHIFSTLREVCDEIHWLKAGGFVQKVERDGFAALNQEMKEGVVGKKVNRLFES